MLANTKYKRCFLPEVFFFIYSIKVLAFYSFSEATVLELGQSKHSDVCGGWIDVCLVDGQLI